MYVGYTEMYTNLGLRAYQGLDSGFEVLGFRVSSFVDFTVQGLGLKFGV